MGVISVTGPQYAIVDAIYKKRIIRMLGQGDKPRVNLDF